MCLVTTALPKFEKLLDQSEDAKDTSRHLLRSNLIECNGLE